MKRVATPAIALLVVACSFDYDEGLDSSYVQDVALGAAVEEDVRTDPEKPFQDSLGQENERGQGFMASDTLTVQISSLDELELSHGLPPGSFRVGVTIVLTDVDSADGQRQSNPADQSAAPVAGPLPSDSAQASSQSPTPSTPPAPMASTPAAALPTMPAGSVAASRSLPLLHHARIANQQLFTNALRNLNR